MSNYLLKMVLLHALSAVKAEIFLKIKSVVKETQGQIFIFQARSIAISFNFDVEFTATAFPNISMW